MSLASLTTKMLLQHYTFEQLEELQKTLDSRTYRYIIGIDTIEVLSANDLGCLKPIVVDNAEDLLFKLYEDDKIIKYLYGTSSFRDKNKTRFGPIFDIVPTPKHIINEITFTDGIRSLINKDTIYESIIEHSNDDIKIFDNSFNRVRLINTGAYEIEKIAQKTKLYSYTS